MAKYCVYAGTVVGGGAPTPGVDCGDLGALWPNVTSSGEQPLQITPRIEKRNHIRLDDSCFDLRTMAHLRQHSDVLVSS